MTETSSARPAMKREVAGPTSCASVGRLVGYQGPGEFSWSMSVESGERRRETNGKTEDTHPP